MGQNENKIIMHLVKLFGRFQLLDKIRLSQFTTWIKTETSKFKINIYQNFARGWWWWWGVYQDKRLIVRL